MIKVIYPENRFSLSPVIIGGMGTIPIAYQKLTFDENEAVKIMKMIQQKNIIGSVKILKNFINYKT